MKPRSETRQSLALPHLMDRLRQGEIKLTGQRQHILEILDAQKHPLTIKQIHVALPPGHCDLATVYRSMHLLEKKRIVKRFDFGDGLARFELLQEGDDGHHHHLVCRNCSRVVELEECFGREFEQKIASQSGFKGVTHRLEFFGICPKCQ
jgi:Fur family ferric uptake transcriptional regulator